MPLKDILKKKDKLAQQDVPTASSDTSQAVPEFTFMRTDTNTQEIIEPPTYAGDVQIQPPKTPSSSPPTNKQRFNRFRKASSAAAKSAQSVPEKEQAGEYEKKRLSQRLHLVSRSRSSSTSSANLPPELPSIEDPYTHQNDSGETEAQWEARATILATGTSPANSQPQTSSASIAPQLPPSPSTNGSPTQLQRPRAPTRAASDAETDSTIQDAIRLHESGQLAEATTLFSKLAADGNVLSQVLYGLSLRHGWGCEPDPSSAVTYLRAAASNSAVIESEALKAGMKKGGAAKGELVLAIFELANCFRYGWGVDVDKPAARQYYETAANLGDTDAMEAAAWCYLEGFGGKKDKVSCVNLLFCFLHKYNRGICENVMTELETFSNPGEAV